MKKFSTRNLFKILFIVLICGLLVFLNPKGFFDPIRIFVEKITYPFKKISYTVSRKVDSWGEFVFSIGKMKEENSRMLIRNQELLSENARLRDMERENNLLREQVGLLPRDKYDLEPAFVIGRDPQGLGNFIEIDKGSGDGVAEGMAVTVSKGVMIGKIEQAFSDKSLVMLITNPKNAINSIVLQSGAKCLVKGEYGLGVIADSILQTDSVSVGNEIVTSGIGSQIPKGLLIGTVEQVRPSSDHLFRQAVISSPVEASSLDLVFVIKNSKQ